MTHAKLATLLFCAAVTSAVFLSGCTHPPAQSVAAPLPANDAETRAQQRARDLRTMNPSLTESQALSQAVSEIAGEDARAEAEFREKQKAGAQQEKFRKDLDASLDKPR
jgi:hypothetical protein